MAETYEMVLRSKALVECYEFWSSPARLVGSDDDRAQALHMRECALRELHYLESDQMTTALRRCT
jgi:hypothetical protein